MKYFNKTCASDHSEDIMEHGKSARRPKHCPICKEQGFGLVPMTYTTIHASPYLGQQYYIDRQRDAENCLEV